MKDNVGRDFQKYLSNHEVSRLGKNQVLI